MAARYWAVVPAAGVGKRMQADRPKQYLPLGDKTVIEHTLDALCALEELQSVVVARNDDDPYWPDLVFDMPCTVLTAPGGKQRADSVLSGLQCLPAEAVDDDWVLVHDAARPCLRSEDLHKLIASVQDSVGGILAIPTRDTMKQATPEGAIEATLDRSRMWNALTPQMFRVGALKTALEQASRDGFQVTDEASAMEHAGFHPLLVEGHADNIKITRPEDLALAEFFLKQQGRL